MNASRVARAAWPTMVVPRQPGGGKTGRCHPPEPLTLATLTLTLTLTPALTRTRLETAPQH
eukprot:scaffold135507_cov316-Phaeocystis_antarctica.AAC.4